MKVVLQEHVENLGERGEVVAVAAGYARNFLFPQRLALEATQGNLRFVEEQRKVWEVKEARAIGEAQAVVDRLADVKLEVSKKAGDGGTLYGSVPSMEIARLLSEQGIELDRRKLQLAHPIKTVGIHEIKYKVHPKVVASFQLEVLAEGGPVALEAGEETPDFDEENELEDEERPDTERSEAAAGGQAD